MVRLKNDPVYILMIRAASSKSIASCLPAFVALLSSLDHWRKAEAHDHRPFCPVFIQMFFNKDNYGKNFTALQQSVYLDPQTLRKYWNFFKQNFFKEYTLCRALPQQLLIIRFFQFLYDKDLCKLVFPYRFLTLDTVSAFLAEMNLSEPDRQFYLRLLDSGSSIKPFTYEDAIHNSK